MQCLHKGGRSRSKLRMFYSSKYSKMYFQIGPLEKSPGRGRGEQMFLNCYWQCAQFNPVTSPVSPFQRPKFQPEMWLIPSQSFSPSMWKVTFSKSAYSNLTQFPSFPLSPQSPLSLHLHILITLYPQQQLKLTVSYQSKTKILYY